MNYRDYFGGDLTGQCYVVSEALYHLRGGKKAGLTPMVLRIPGVGTHWWVRAADGSHVDLTAEQFDFTVDYDAGKGCGFLTRQPSKRAQKFLDWLAHTGVSLPGVS